jgi:hypothetical protein
MFTAVRSLHFPLALTSAAMKSIKEARRSESGPVETRPSTLANCSGSCPSSLPLRERANDCEITSQTHTVNGRKPSSRSIAAT